MNAANVTNLVDWTQVGIRVGWTGSECQRFADMFLWKGKGLELLPMTPT